jgi:ribosome-associated protein
MTQQLGWPGSGPEVTNGAPNEQAARYSRRATPDLRERIATAEGGPLKIATVSSEPTATLAAALDRALLSARVAQDHKARDITVLDMRAITPLYDYVVLATGGSRRQIHTLAEEIDAALRAEGDERLGIEGYEASRWVVQDYGDVVVHVFDAEARSYYALEELWPDAARVDWEHL